MEQSEGLERFVAAQNGVYQEAFAELLRGRKESHWMWFIFPQIAGLGTTAMSQRFAIRSADEARRYLAHSLLGTRLLTCTAAVLEHRDRSAKEILGTVDAMKFRSSMTLFDGASNRIEPIFAEALAVFYDGAPDERTLALLD